MVCYRKGRVPCIQDRVLPRLLPHTSGRQMVKINRHPEDPFS